MILNEAAEQALAADVAYVMNHTLLAPKPFVVNQAMLRYQQRQCMASTEMD